MSAPYYDSVVLEGPNGFQMTRRELLQWAAEQEHARELTDEAEPLLGRWLRQARERQDREQLERLATYGGVSD